MNILQFILISFLYFFGSSTSWTYGVGYYTLYRPIIVGLLTGVILGDVYTGMIAGAFTNIVYLNFISTGGSLRGDACLTGILTAIFSVIFKINCIEALALGFPVGFLGILIWKYRLNINTYFVKKYINYGNSKNIFLYNALLPQLLLLIMSVAVIFLCFILMYVFSNVINNYLIKNSILFLAGTFILLNSTISFIIKIKDIRLIAMMVAIFVISMLLKNDIIIYLCIIVLLYLIYCDCKLNIKYIKKTDSKLSKSDLFRSWSVWMNFSHACYNFERMQGMGFAHCMKNIIYKLYSDENKRLERIMYYTDFFNVEPNIGTPIHGYTISLEEKFSRGEQTLNINELKRSMMGAISGLGDSYTQTVLSPIFISICIYFALSHSIFAVVICSIFLSGIIIYISFIGFIVGYYDERAGVIARINKVKKSKLKKYSEVLCTALLALIISKLAGLQLSSTLFNISDFLTIFVCSLIYQLLILKKVKEGYIIGFIYLIPLFLQLI